MFNRIDGLNLLQKRYSTAFSIDILRRPSSGSMFRGSDARPRWLRFSMVSVFDMSALDLAVLDVVDSLIYRSRSTIWLVRL